MLHVSLLLQHDAPPSGCGALRARSRSSLSAGPVTKAVLPVRALCEGSSWLSCSDSTDSHVAQHFSVTGSESTFEWQSIDVQVSCCRGLLPCLGRSRSLVLWC
jgi:hypothetical protein